MSLDTTIGGSASDSYVPIAYIDNYVANHYLSTDSVAIAWAALSPSDKEVLARKACVFIDSHRFDGCVVTGTQKLQWPRIDVYVNGYFVDSTTIPPGVKDAQCEAALKSMSGDLLADIERGSVIEETVGPLTTRYSDYSKDGSKSYPVIDALLKPYCQHSGGRNYHRVVR